MSKTSVVILTLLQICICFTSGDKESGSNNYVDFYNGNINVLITVAHGGYLKPDSISDRPSDPLDNLLPDRNTIEMSIVIRETLANLFSGSSNYKPFMIVNNLNRVKMDPNRNMSECCADVGQDALMAYNEFHNYIRSKFILEFLSTSAYKQALLLDIHGQSHEEKWIELGYVLTKQLLNNNGTLLNPEFSSVCSMSTNSKYSFDDIIRGDSVSLGAIIKKNNPELEIVPSPDIKAPKSGNYYNGGFISQMHGSKNCDGSTVNAIQVELPSIIRTNISYAKYARSLAFSFYEFYMIHSFDQKQ